MRYGTGAIQSLLTPDSPMNLTVYLSCLGQPTRLVFLIHYWFPYTLWYQGHKTDLPYPVCKLLGSSERMSMDTTAAALRDDRRRRSQDHPHFTTVANNETRSIYSEVPSNNFPTVLTKNTPHPITLRSSRLVRPTGLEPASPVY